MWWRTILTAVAISCTFTREIIVRAHGQGPQRIVQIKDVLCMLLWSGLQKEELDAKTLEKLNRYNVNIDDMNNEQQRQECLSEHITTEVQQKALGTLENKEGMEKYVSEMYPKIEKLSAPDFDNKVVLQHGVNPNTSKDNFDPISEIARKIPDLGNVTKVGRNKGTIKIEYDIHNQQDIESVMKVWTKLTRSNSSVVPNAEDAILSTTSTSPSTATEEEETNKQKNVTPLTQPETHNHGYVHSREMEYINRILSEYLASPTVPTTTQRVSIPKLFLNDIPMKYWKLPSEASVKDEPNRLNEQRREISKIKDISQDSRRYSNVLDETKNTLFDTAQLIKSIQVSPYNQLHRNELTDRESKPVNNNNPISFLLNILQMNNALYNNGVLIPETYSTAQTMPLFPNKNNEPQEKSKSDNLFHLFQNMNYVNKSISKNYMMNNVEPTIVPINVNTWGSVHQSHEKINKEPMALPINKKDMYQVQNLYNQFVTAPLNIITMKQINPYGEEIIVTSEPEQIQKFYTNNNRIKVIPPDINTSKLHQNSYIEPKQPYQDMLPTIKNSNSEYTNNQVIGMNTRFKKLDRNENNELFSDKKAVVNRNYAFKADSRVITKREPPYDFYKMNSINNLDLDNGPHSPINEKRVKPTEHAADSLNTHELKEIPASIIKEIAEKVKVMVLKHIEVSSTTTATPFSTTTPITTTPTTTTTTTTPTTTTPTTTTSTTTTPTTTSTFTTTTTTSEKPSKSLQQEFSQTNQVIQKLMEIFKELKATKETTKLTPEVPQITTTVNYGTSDTPPPSPIQANPQLANSFNPYHMQNHVNLERIQAPIKVPEQNKAPQYMPPLSVQPTKDYYVGAITVQTNSNEIPPLAVQLSKPLKFVSQNIILTTKQPADILKEEQKQNSIKHVEDKLGFLTKAKNYREEPKHQSDLLTKHGRLSDDIKKHESREHNFYKSKYMNREKPWYNHEYNDNEKVRTIESTHDKSRFTDFNYPGRLSHFDHLNRPREMNLEDLNHSSGYTRPGLNELGSHQSERHHKYSISNYDHQTRYEPTKFHEKLERVRDWPRSSLNDLPQENSDEIPGRQQMPLTKVKQRTKYDDSHFKNFLKSQQKVTDMLEKILANHSMNSGQQHSVETQ